MHAQKVIDLIMDQVTSGVNGSQVCIITRKWSSATQYARLLNDEGMKAQVFNKQQGLKLGDECVNIITAHSAKGLEFPMVIVPEITGDTYPDQEKIEQARDKADEADIRIMEQRLLYVAMSRACRKLWILEDSNNRCDFLQKLDSGLWHMSSI